MKVLLVSAIREDLDGAVRALEKLGINAVTAAVDEDISEMISEEFAAVYLDGKCARSGFLNSLEKLAAVCGASEIPVIYDPDFCNLQKNDTADAVTANKLAALVDVFIPSIEDAKALCGLDDPEDAAKHYLSLGVRKVVVTLDKQGAYFKSAKESGYAPTFRADKVIDTRGAGTAFAAGLISGVTEELPLGEAVVRANACGCMAIQDEGDMTFPTMSELREYMLSHRFAVEGCKDF